MVFEKLKKLVESKNDERYEFLYYKYSKLKLENENLIKELNKEKEEFKNKVSEKVANHLITLFEDVEDAKNNSSKVNITDPNVQRLLMSLNKIERDIKKIMKDYMLEEIEASERMFDPELHEVASYQDARGMQKGIILKTVKKGFMYKNKRIKKPKVIVTK